MKDIYVILPEGIDALMRDFIVDVERAMEQRDRWKETRVSTAGHGGSYDSCLGFIMKKHLSTLPVDLATSNQLLRELIARKEKDKSGNLYYASGIIQALGTGPVALLNRLVKQYMLEVECLDSSSKNTLLEYGLITHFCCNGTSGYIAATPLGYSIIDDDGKVPKGTIL